MKKSAGTSSRGAVALPICLITPSYTVRQKTVLKSSCAVVAMFAMPVAAMSLGIVLARPAAAATTLGSTSNTPVLSSYETGNPFTINNGTTIATAPGTGGDGVFGDGSQNWTLTNYGVVSGGSANGIGFGNGGTITNTTAPGPNAPGTITGASDGIYISGNTGVVLNSGIISGTGNSGVELRAGGNVQNFGASAIYGSQSGVTISNGAGTVYNGGSISASGIGGTGVGLSDGGTVTNTATASILGNSYGISVTGGAGYVANAGRVLGASGTGVLLSTGSVTNTGSIYGNTGVAVTGAGYVENAGGSSYIEGKYAGVSIGGANGSVVNSGTIRVNNYNNIPGQGVALANGGTVTNNSGATIIAYGQGVDVNGAAGTVLNAGVLMGMGLTDPSGTAARLNAGGYVYNTGTMFGSLNGVAAFNAPATIMNTGSLYAGQQGVLLDDGGTVTNQAGGYIRGGTNGIKTAGAAGSVYNRGNILGGTGVYLGDGGTVTNNGGTILGQYNGISVHGAPGTVFNSGVIAYGLPPDTPNIVPQQNGVYMNGGGSVINTGYISGQAFGVDIIGYTAAFVTNASNAYIKSSNSDGVFLRGSSNSLDNAGTIYGGGYAAVVLRGGGNVNNQASAAIYGNFVGIASNDGTDTITNAGYIGGGYAGIGIYGGAVTNAAGGLITGGHNGVFLTTAGTVTNSGTIIDSGTNQNEDYRNSGIALYQGGTVVNDAGGTIAATYSGTIDNYVGGVGVFAAAGGASVDNSGLIIGGAGVGLIAGGTITNESGGLINGTFVGAYIGGTYATVINHEGGTIAGGEIGVDMGAFEESTLAQNNFLDNAGAIYAGGIGVVMSGGTLINEATGLISASSLGIGSYGPNTSIYNAGTIQATYGTGVELGSGSLVNAAAGVIYGSDTGVETFGSAQSSVVISNAGSITGAEGAGIALSNGGTVINEGGGTIIGGIDGIAATGSYGVSIVNSGLITGYTGISLTSGGNITNRGTGTITGDLVGVYTGNVGATVTNYGLIEAANPNAGTGIQMAAGGSVINEAGGTVTGDYYGVLVSGGAATINNAGTIFGGARDGVKLDGGGGVTNSGIVYSNNVGINATAGIYVDNLGNGGISGANYGILTSGSLTSTVVNAGGIFGDIGDGIALRDNGSVTNASSGFIAGGEDGVFLANAGYVQNAGLILGETNIGVDLDNGGLVNNSGGITGDNDGVGFFGDATTATTGTLINSGSIGGGYNGVYAYNAASVQNSGTITGFQLDGVYLYNGGTVTNTGIIAAARDGVDLYAANGGLTSNNVVNGGYIYGGVNGVYAYNAGSVQNSGTIIGQSDNGVYFRNGGTVTNSGTIIGGRYGVDLYSRNGTLVSSTVVNSGVISGGNYGVYGYGAGLSLLNTGTITGNVGVEFDGGPASITNGGVIAGSESGVFLQDGGTVVNTGMISGATGVTIVGGGVVNNELGGTITGYDGVRMSGSVAQYIMNAGLITGTGSFGYGIVFDGGGTISNASTGTISGQYSGAFIYGPGASVNNAGQISGQVYDGLFLLQAGTVTNSGTITGANNGIQLGFAEFPTASSGTVLNTGTITGGATGIDGYGTSLYVENAGFIGGATGVSLAGGVATLVNSGMVTGTYGNAIELAAGGSVSNSGAITGAANGVVAGGPLSLTNSGAIMGDGTLGEGVVLDAGGTVANLAGGTIAGAGGGVVGYQYVTDLSNNGSIGASSGAAVDLTAGGSVGNAGMISGATDGIYFASGGTLTNSSTGKITGGTDGVDAPAGARVTNAGTITGTGNDGVLLNGGLLDNQKGGVILGGANGIYAGGGAIVGNSGIISDNSTAGAMLGDNVALNNLGGGLISGVTGIAFTGTGASVFDSGTIASTTGADAISFDAAGTNSLTLSSGAVIVGAIDGGGSNSSIELVGHGLINNTIANFGAGSSLTVAPGAFWTATGNWTVATVYNDGTFEAGTLNPDPPLYLTGNFVQGSMGTLQVVVTPTMSTQFIVSGTAKVAGTLSYIFTPGTYTPHSYSFLTAKGGVTGSFTTVDYTGDVPPVFAVAHTTTLGDAADDLVLSRGAGVPGGPLLVRPADDGIFSAQAEAMAEQAQQASDGLLGHATDAANGNTAAKDAACAAAARVPQAGGTPSSMSGRMADAMASAFCGAGGWVEATGTEMHVDASNGAADYHANSGGFLAGVDKAVDPSGGRIGFAIGYDETNLSDGAGGSAKIGTTRVGLYGAQPVGRFTLAADFMYGHADDKTDRQTGIGTAQAKHGSDIVSGAVQISTGMLFDGFGVMPAAGLRIAHVSSAAFAESGGAGYLPLFAVSGTTPDYTSVQPYVKVDVSRSFVTPSYVVITPQASIGYDFEAGDRGRAASEITDDGTRFSTTYNRLDTGAANVSAGLSVGKGNWSLFARYSAVLSSNWTAQTAEGGVQVKF